MNVRERGDVGKVRREVPHVTEPLCNRDHWPKTGLRAWVKLETG